ncbi:hypothetical protein [Acinetobacter indicus]|uniref:hypothetical protein n=1 Tax=Acinetobacter indicus TaxID=756892 RepID=UPI00144400E9|nr:hypothetical protein [Acinetobacter indicus]
MDILFYILCAIVGIFITYIFGIQFYKLGQNLKNRFPIIYRLYAIFWSIIVAIILVGVLAGVKSKIDDYQHNKSIYKFSTFLSTKHEVDMDVAYVIINDLKREKGYISDGNFNKLLALLPVFRESYESAKQSSSLSEYYAKSEVEKIAAQKQPVITKDIENKLYAIGYWQRPVEKQITVEQMTQLAVDDAVKLLQKSTSEHPQADTPKVKKYYTFDMFIAPDLQEKVGVNTYKLQSMIADAKNAQKQDKQIYEMLKETVQYGLIINEYEEGGLSENQIAEKFGLSF